MPDAELSRMLLEAAAGALETMCFASVLEARDRPPSALCRGEDSITALLRFCGDCRGTLGLCISRTAAAPLTANLLGLEDESGVRGTDAELLVRELANVICGSFLSSCWSDSKFVLQPAEIVDCRQLHWPPHGPCQELDLGDGVLNTWIELEAGPPPEAAGHARRQPDAGGQVGEDVC